MKRVRLISALLPVCLLLCSCAPSALRTPLAPSTGAEDSRPPETVQTPGQDAENARREAEEQNTLWLAERILRDMSVEEKVGQMFIIRCPESGAEEVVDRYEPGGYILFANRFDGRTKRQVADDVREWQDESDVPMLIGVDEEGGTVNRVSRYTAFRAVPFWSPQELYSEGGFGLVRSDTEEKAKLLKSLGINLNFAPVCDVPSDSGDFIYRRSFGTDAQQTAEYVKIVVEEMNRRKIGCVLKHFPGYGDNGDTHTDVVHDMRPYETFVSRDFLPFQAGIDAGAGCVLVAHNIVACMDGDYPASLSPAVHQILREELGFGGVIITDDLAMEGVKKYADNASVAVQAVAAGNDMLTCTDYEEQIPAVIRAVQSGEITESRLDESVLRILKWKIGLGIIDRRDLDD